MAVAFALPNRPPPVVVLPAAPNKPPPVVPPAAAGWEAAAVAPNMLPPAAVVGCCVFVDCPKRLVPVVALFALLAPNKPIVVGAAEEGCWVVDAPKILLAPPAGGGCC